MKYAILQMIKGWRAKACLALSVLVASLAWYCFGGVAWQLPAYILGGFAVWFLLHTLWHMFFKRVAVEQAQENYCYVRAGELDYWWGVFGTKLKGLDGKPFTGYTSTPEMQDHVRSEIVALVARQKKLILELEDQCAQHAADRTVVFDILYAAARSALEEATGPRLGEIRRQIVRAYLIAGGATGFNAIEKNPSFEIPEPGAVADILSVVQANRILDATRPGAAWSPFVDAARLRIDRARTR